MSTPPDLDQLTPTQLKELVVRLLDEVAELKQTVARQREEIARLKRLKGRPVIKPSGMDEATEPGKPGRQAKRPRRGKVRPRGKVEDRVLRAEAPVGSRFKGCETYLVEELVLSVHAIRYRRERWVTPEGQTIIAPLPSRRPQSARRPSPAATRPMPRRARLIHAAGSGFCPYYSEAKQPPAK